MQRDCVVTRQAGKYGDIVAATAFDTVVSGTADQQVVAATAGQHILAAAALELVGKRVARDIVVATRTDDVLDIADLVRAAVLAQQAGRVDNHQAVPRIAEYKLVETERRVDAPVSVDRPG